MNHKPLILIVDDTPLNRSFLRDMLEQDYQIIEASSGLEAISVLRQYDVGISLVLLDVVMPEMDGFEVLELMNKNHWLDNIPVVMISAETSPDYIVKGYELGATDYISRPFDTSIVQRRVHNTIMLYAKQKTLQNLVTDQIREKERNNILMIDILSTIVEFRNGESGEHVLRIRIITEILLESLSRHYPEYHLDSSAIANISNAAALHDIGKIVISEQILNKPDKLTSQEFETIKVHTIKGAEMLENIRFGKNQHLVKYAHDICRWHHERWDGKGYPDGLAANQIPIWAQTVALADVYDALISPRVYKPAYPHSQTIDMILSGACGQFNPDLIDCLLREQDVIQQRIKLQSDTQENILEPDNIFDIENLSRQISMQKGAGLSERSLLLLERQRVKNQFFIKFSNEILFDYDISTNTVILSEQASRILGLEMNLSEAREHISHNTIFSKGDYEDLCKRVHALSPQSPMLRHTYLLNLPDGNRRWFEFIIRVLWSEDPALGPVGCIGKLIDAKSEKVKEISPHYDWLTGLYNGATAQKLISSAMQRHPEQMSALLLLDVDDFKEINDARGHIFGDAVLQHIAKTIEQNIRYHDIAARIGGDEFIVFLQGIRSAKSIHQQAERLWYAIQESVEGFRFSVSIGIAVFPTDAGLYDKLLQYAGDARYASKTSGKNCFTFYSSQP